MNLLVLTLIITTYTTFTCTLLHLSSVVAFQYPNPLLRNHRRIHSNDGRILSNDSDCSKGLRIESLYSAEYRFAKRRSTRTTTTTTTTTPTTTTTTTALSSSSSKPSSKNEGVTSTLISNLAVIALKLRLSSQTSVQCNVQSSSRQLLLKQSIGPVSVRGKDWSSPLGLTCKAIQADVDKCMLDMNAVLKRRKLILLEPAKGVAMIAFNDLDFGNFLDHPLLKAQSPSLSSAAVDSFIGSGDKSTSVSASDASTFVFQKDNITIQNDASGDGYVTFYGHCMGQRWKCILKRGVSTSTDSKGRTASIQVYHDGNIAGNTDTVDGDITSLETELTMIINNFFNELVFELDGTFLSFRDLRFHTTSTKSVGKSKSNILFALDITVKKFPSPGLAF